MIIILTDGTEKTALIVTGGQKYFQGANRDALTFVFAETSIDEIDADFTEANCESITLIGDDGSENIHKGYVIRTELTKKPVVVTSATDTEPEITEMRVMVTMAQRTYNETQMANIAEEVTNTQLALCEVYEMMA